MKDFIKYFRGLERNYGFCNIEKGYTDQESGKLKFNPGDYGWSAEPILDKDYIEHLNGKKSIGIQPCNDEGMASFGAIDIDPKNYTNFKIENYLKIIAENNLPVIPIKSKSGGLHTYVFTTEPIEASEIRKFLETLLFTFGLPANTEIYPKQTKLGINTDGKYINGNFINLPYFNKKERVALLPDGRELTFEQFLDVVKENLQTKESLRKSAEDLIRKQLTGGPEEFSDGPPCLQAITKELTPTNKLNDERDRFLYNYMVFAKKKFKDSWEDKVLEAARAYIVYDNTWGDEKVKKKIKDWKKDTAGHTCHENPIARKCSKPVCLKRKYGIISQVNNDWPMLSGLTKIDYKPDPEFYINVARPNGEVALIHAKHVKQIIEQKELKALIASQTEVVPPPIKSKDFQAILNGLWANLDVQHPAFETTPREVLFELTKEYLNGPKATSYTSFNSGAVYIEGDYAYCKFQPYFDELKSREWRNEAQRTSHMLEKFFGVVFKVQKRFPGKDSKGKSFPSIRCMQLQLSVFEQESSPVEIIAMDKKEEII